MHRTLLCSDRPRFPDPRPAQVVRALARGLPVTTAAGKRAAKCTHTPIHPLGGPGALLAWRTRGPLARLGRAPPAPAFASPTRPQGAPPLLYSTGASEPTAAGLAVASCVVAQAGQGSKRKHACVAEPRRPPAAAAAGLSAGAGAPGSMRAPAWRRRGQVAGAFQQPAGGRAGGVWQERRIQPARARFRAPPAMPGQVVRARAHNACGGGSVAKRTRPG